MFTPRFRTSALVVPVALLLIGGTLLYRAPSPRPVPAAPSDTVDTKRLRLLMVGLAQDMARINTGLWHEDYDLIRQGAASIARHPKIPPAQIAKIKEALGDNFQNFVQFDKVVHGRAKRLVRAAEARDWSGVLTTYTQIRDGCLGCHTAYRERLRPVLAPRK